jgi:hypothetical protein
MPSVSQIEIPLPFTAATATAAAATAVTVTAPAAPGAQRVLYFVAASVSVAASGAVTLTVADGATTVLSLDLALAVGVPYVLNLPAGLAGSMGNTMTVTLSATAATSVGKLNIGYDAL